MQAIERAIRIDFPEKNAWPVSSGGLLVMVFRDGGPATFPKRGLSGNVGVGCVPHSAQAEDGRGYQKFRGFERGTPSCSFMTPCSSRGSGGQGTTPCVPFSFYFAVRHPATAKPARGKGVRSTGAQRRTLAARRAQAVALSFLFSLFLTFLREGSSPEGPKPGFGQTGFTRVEPDPPPGGARTIEVAP